MTQDSICYFDHAATTPVAPEVLRAMLPYFGESFGNPSSSHRMGVKAHRALDEARRALAQSVGCRQAGVVFTGGGTEADVIVLRGAVSGGKRPRHMVVSAVEHPAVLETARSLERQGHRLTVVPVDAEGVVDAEAFVDAVTEDTAVAALMAVNNELGTIEPVAEVSERVKAKRPDVIFHVDAVQAFGRLPVGFTQWPRVDTIAVSAHKIYGPKGVGALFLHETSHLEPIITGGGQEGGLRSGTHNVPGAIGLAEAFRLAYQRRPLDLAHYRELSTRLLERLGEALPDAAVNGPQGERRVPYTVNVRFPGVPAEPLLNGLEEAGFCLSAGSACQSGHAGPSHVLSAIGLKESDGGSIRISFGRGNEVADVDRLVGALSQLVPRLKAVASQRV
jgi:cysteine desulfurase